MLRAAHVPRMRMRLACLSVHWLRGWEKNHAVQDWGKHMSEMHETFDRISDKKYNKANGMDAPEGALPFAEEI